jgi:hypothetical protein
MRRHQAFALAHVTSHDAVSNICQALARGPSHTAGRDWRHGVRGALPRAAPRGPPHVPPRRHRRQGLTLAQFKAQLEDLREHIAHVRAQLEHLLDTSTGD